MNRSGSSKSGLFLMELIFVILLFAISSAICLQMFGYASNTAQRAEDLSYATMAARSAAACYQATDGSLDEMAALLSGTSQDNTVLVGYDQKWQSTAGTPSYQLSLTQSGALAHITVSEPGQDQPIYTLTVSIPGGDGL